MSRTTDEQNRIDVKRNECNTKALDSTRCRAELTVLVPEEQVSERATQERAGATAFATEMTAKKTASVSSIDNLIANLNNAIQSQDALRNQKDELAAQKAKLNKENEELEQSIRANRRRFLDNDPQEGTPSFLGFRTSDDKVLLFFWLALLLFTNLVVFAYFAYKTIPHNRNIYIIINAVVILIAYGILYYHTKIEYKLRPTTL